jgi:hypothetical protein
MESEETAFQVQDSIRDIFYRELMPELDRILSEIAPDNRIYRFDQLKIDLGRIDASNLESELISGIITRLKAIIPEKISLADYSSVDGVELSEHTTMGSLCDAFLYFLRTGLMPWWVGGNGSASPENIFKDIPGNLLPEHRTAINLALTEKIVSLRLARQFSAGFAGRLFDNLNEPFFAGTETSKEHGISKNNKETTFLKIITGELMHAISQMNISNRIPGLLRMSLTGQFAGISLLRYQLSEDFILQGKVENSDIWIEKAFELLAEILFEHYGKSSAVQSHFRNLKKVLSDKTLTGRWLHHHSKAVGSMISAKGKAVHSVQDNQVPVETDLKTTKLMAGDGDDELLKHGVYIDNAGLVILWPFLESFFSVAGLMSRKLFKNTGAKERGLLLLQYLVFEEQNYFEQNMILNKVLCGWPLQIPVINDLEITSEEKNECRELLSSVIEIWTAIGKVSIAGLRESFLKREGKIWWSDEGWKLKIQRKTHDILIDRLPWMISMIRLQWMEKMVFVEW